MKGIFKKTFHVLPNEDDSKNLLHIGYMSFFWSMASLMVFSLLPIFAIEVLNLKKIDIGLIEGVAISMAFMAKIISGTLSDYLRKRKPLIIIGTALGLITKTMFAFASSGVSLFIARGFDRIAKGIRSAPTDALIADTTHKKYEGASYGVRQTLYTLGAVVGSLTASALIYLTHGNFRIVFALAILPTIGALVLVSRFITEPPQHYEAQKSKLNFKDIPKLPISLWQLYGVAFVLMLARFSESFLSLRGRDVGMSLAMIPLVIVGYEIVHSITALPLGKFADRFDRKKLLFIGICVLIVTNLIMLITDSLAGVMLCFMLAGLHLGMTQGLISALIAENTLPHLRGTAFSIYYFTIGVAVFFANFFAGFLSDLFATSKAPFIGGLVFSSLAAYVLKRQKLSVHHNLMNDELKDL